MPSMDERIRNAQFKPSGVEVPYKAVIRCLLDGLIALEDMQMQNQSGTERKEKVK